MLELEDIEILPESMPPADTESAPVWMIVVALAIVLAIAALIIRALSSKANETSNKTNPLEIARAQFLQISDSLSNANTTESFPTIIHAWANKQLEQPTALPGKVVDELTRTRDLLAPHCYHPAIRWHKKIDPDTILATLAASLDVDLMNHRKGGETSDA